MVRRTDMLCASDAILRFRTCAQRGGQNCHRPRLSSFRTALHCDEPRGMGALVTSHAS